MALRDLVDNLKVSSVLLPAVRTADANGSSVDMQGYESLAFEFHLGAPGDTLSSSVKIEAEVQHSDDNSTFVACADADITAPVTGTNTGTFASVQANADASRLYKVGYKGVKRYVRVASNVSGTHTNGTPSSCVALQGRAAQSPVA